MMRILCVALAIFLFSGLQQLDSKAKSSGQGRPQSDQSGSQESPIVVKVLPSTKTEQEISQETKDREHKAANDKNLVNGTYILAAIGFFQLFVFGYQALKLKETVKSASEQSEAMERSIQESARSASAMERVAKHIEVSAQAATDSVAALKDRTAKQMRAYVAVIIGNGVYQERREGMGDLKFQAKPEIKNTGHTPAKNLRIQIKAAILPVPLPNDFGFPLSPRTEGAAMLGAQQTAMLSAVVDEFVPDEEVAAIKEGAARALYVWGLITYDDIFGESHSTKFCQWLTWLPNRTVFGYYIPGYNDGD